MSKHVIILSIPESLPDAAIEDALSAHADGYYLAFMLPPRNGNLRAVLKRTWNYVDPAQRAARDAEESTAIEVVRAHPELSQGRIVGVLAAKGIKRTAAWVGQQRARMAYSGGK